MTDRVRRDGDTLRLVLEAWEADLLRRLRDGLRETLTGGGPEDPVIARLFPPAVEGDDEADEQLRALIGTELLTDRLEGLDAIVDLLDDAEEEEGGRLRVRLEEDEPALVLGVLNDLRLAIGARAGIEDLDRSTLSPDDPAAPSVAVMDHLAWLQEQLLGTLDPEALSFYDDLGHGDAGG